MMKFNLSDFVQLDTKGLLAVNGGGYYCNGSSNTTVYSNPYYTGSSGSGSCSTSTSNNPNGQGPSTTSSNPGGNQHKDTKIHSGGGTCTKTGGHSPVNPNPTNLDDVTSGGGTCSSKNDTDKVSGMFGQITDGSYADTLTMQKYKNEPYKYQPNLDEKMNGDGNTFSTKGCLMTAVAINRIYKTTSK